MILFLRNKNIKAIKQDTLIYKIWVSRLNSPFQRKRYHVYFLRLLFFSFSCPFESQLFITIFTDYKYFYFSSNFEYFLFFSANTTTLHKCFLTLLFLLLLLLFFIVFLLRKLFRQFFLILPHEVLIPKIYSVPFWVLCISVLYTQKE